MKVQMQKVYLALASRRVAKFGLMALACIGLGTLHACRQDDMTTSQQSSAETHKSGLVNLDLGDIELDPEVAIHVASTTTSARGIELATKADGSLPNFQFALGQTEEDFPVVLGLVGAKQDIDCYARATWKLIKMQDKKTGKMRYYVHAKGSATTFSPAPDWSKLTQDEEWYLHALYAPEGTWEPTTKSWVYKPTHKVTKLFALGDKLTIGTDIDIPFVLGSNRQKGDPKDGWSEGYPLFAQMNPLAPNGWSFNYKILKKTNQTEVEAKPRFKMQGALYAFTLQNTQRSESYSSKDKDDAFIAKLSNRPVYDYLIKAFFVESTVATNEVRYKFDNLRRKIPESYRHMPGYELLFANGRINQFGDGFGIKAEPVTNPTLEKPTRIHFPISDGTNELNVGQKSKVFYFWMSDIDATEIANKTKKGDGTSLSVNLYNKTYKMTTGMKNIYTFTKKEHTSGAIYRTPVSINEEASFNPLARIAPGYISRNSSGVYYFSDAMSDVANNAPNNLDGGNGNPGSGQLFNAKEIRTIGQNKQTANFSKVNNFSNLNGDNGLVTFSYSDLKWIVPDKYDIYSVFPYNKDGQKVSDGVFRHGQADKLIIQTDEDVRLDGRRMTVTSYYYREKSTSAEAQKNNSDQDVVYAYRFVGTPYATVFRYTLSGAWYKTGARGQEAPTIPSTNSRFQIEARSVGNKYKYNNAQLSEAEAKKLFKDEFIKSSFWESKDVIRRRLFVNGEQVQNSHQYVGQRLDFWTRPRPNENPSGGFGIRRPEGTAGLYHVTRQDYDGLYWNYGNAVRTTGNEAKSYILFWLSVDQS